MVTGTPTQPGTFDFTIAAQGYTTCSQPKNYSLTIDYCQVTPSVRSLSFPFSGGSSSLNVTAVGSCIWAATTSDTWIHLTGAHRPAGSSSGTVSFTVDATGSARTGSISVNGQTVTINQNNPTAACAYTLSPSTAAVPASGGEGTLLVQAPRADCEWRAASQAGWITLTSGMSGTGTGAITY